MFGYWRWQKLENIIIESTNSQEQYRIIHAALKSTIQLDHLGEQVSEWSPTDSVDYQQKLVETNNSLDGLRKYYSKSQIDSMQNILNQKGHLLSEIYATIVKRNENDEHLRQDRQVTVKDTETYVKHYTGHVFRSSREEVTSRSKNRTVTVPSVNELAFLDKELYTISLSVLSDSLAEVNRWLDINVSQMLDAEDAKAERNQKELMDKASGIGKTTFRWGMLFLIFVALLNVANTWRRSKVMKELEKESDKNKKLVEKR